MGKKNKPTGALNRKQRMIHAILQILDALAIIISFGGWFTMLGPRYVQRAIIARCQQNK